MLGSIGRALRGGGLPDRPAPRRHTDLSRVGDVEGDRRFPYQVDGDYLGETRRLEFRHVPETLTLALPSAR